MNMVENVTSDSSTGVHVAPNSGSGVKGRHPSSVLMQLLNTPAVQEALVRRVNVGFGDVYTLSEDAHILTLELDFLMCTLRLCF